MPIYDFKCSRCGTVRELIRKNTDLPPNCTICRSIMQRLPSTPGFKISELGVYKSGYHGNKRQKTQKID